MNIKITARNPEQLQNHLTEVLNVACFVCLQGYVPSKYDIDNAGTTGNWWYKKSENTYDLNPCANNFWAFVRETGENYIVLEFGIRYDKDNLKKSSLCQLLVCWFDFVEIMPNDKQSDLVNGYAM